MLGGRVYSQLFPPKLVDSTPGAKHTTDFEDTHNMEIISDQELTDLAGESQNFDYTPNWSTDLSLWFGYNYGGSTNNQLMAIKSIRINYASTQKVILGWYSIARDANLTPPTSSDWQTDVSIEASSGSSASAKCCGGASSETWGPKPTTIRPADPTEYHWAFGDTNKDYMPWSTLWITITHSAGDSNNYWNKQFTTYLKPAISATPFLYYLRKDQFIMAWVPSPSHPEYAKAWTIYLIYNSFRNAYIGWWNSSEADHSGPVIAKKVVAFDHRQKIYLKFKNQLGVYTEYQYFDGKTSFLHSTARSDLISKAAGMGGYCTCPNGRKYEAAYDLGSFVNHKRLRENFKTWPTTTSNYIELTMNPPPSYPAGYKIHSNGHIASYTSKISFASMYTDKIEFLLKLTMGGADTVDWWIKGDDFVCYHHNSLFFQGSMSLGTYPNQIDKKSLRFDVVRENGDCLTVSGGPQIVNSNFVFYWD